MQLSRDGENWFRPMSRRTLLAAGATSVAGMSIGGPMPQVVDTTLLGVWRAQFDQYRRLGQVISSDLLLPTLIAQTHTLREQSAGTGQRTREELLRLTSRYAEYIGWLVQETGDDQAALWWTQRAVDLAAAGGDQDLAAYGLVRRALVSLYRNDPAQTIELARQAQQHDAPPRVLGLAAQREAQGHALAGDYDSCMRSLDNARTLLGRHASDADPLVLGTTNLRDPAAMITGWCLYDLGRPKEAAQIIGDELARIPPQAVRAHLRYGVRHALAHAAAGELEQACELTRRLLDNAVRVRSATIAVDMRALARTLSRHLTHPAVRELIPELGTALHSMTRHTNGMRTV
jgi:tetratricopeptide (TPR) repeat protein